MDFRSLVPFGRGSLSRTETYDPFARLHAEFDRMLQDMSRVFPFSDRENGDVFLMPRVDMSETKDGLQIAMELPGVEEKDIEIELEDDLLSVRAERHRESEEKDEKRHYHLIERAAGTFFRQFRLPFRAEDDKIAARFDKGVLRIDVPRSKKEKDRRRRIGIAKA
ncbi:MAG: Hsp20/alpha crystallin family protein [Rhodothalassiaceae bacterium]